MGVSEYAEIIDNLEFLPNSPTLFNIGTGRGTLSACFKFNIADSMDGPDSILDTGHKAVMVQKFGGGVGFELSALRAKGAPIASTHGNAMGPVAVLKWLHAGAKMVTQGGKREGAQMGILHVDHPDIEEFISCKDDGTDSLSTFNISVALTDSFMEKARGPNGSENRLLRRMAESAWRTGDPGCFFIDAAERSNPTPHLGKTDGTNPCGEVPLLNNEACNLGSINLGKFVRDNGIDYDRLEEVTRIAVRYLDDVLDQNTFPRPEITDAVRQTRKLGLGVMGWADALARLSIHYDSAQAIILADKVMAHIQWYAELESYRIAKTKGSYPAYIGSPDGRRNATVTCIAPTGTIALIAGCSSGIEPHFDIEWTRETGEGIILEERAISANGFVPRVSRDIDYTWHLKHQAAFQKHVDLAVSKTINMPNDATEDEVFNAYFMAWEMGLKGTTIYRDGSRSKQVLTGVTGQTKDAVRSVNGNVGSTPTTSSNPCPDCQFDLIREEGCENCRACGYSACLV